MINWREKISLKECKNAIRTFAKRKSPGDDGLTWEVYNFFFDLLGRDSVECFNASFRGSEMLISQKRGVITIIIIIIIIIIRIIRVFIHSKSDSHNIRVALHT